MSIKNLCASLLFVLLALPALALDLITVDEARRPDDFYDDLRASPFPAPEIRVHGLYEKMTSPLDLVIEIRPYGGASINVNSLQLTYQKTPKENLLPRVRNFVEMRGQTLVIPLQNAVVPLGLHQIVIFVEDSRGRAAEKPLTFQICAKTGCL